MAYTGRGFQRTWTYEPTGDDHNARVGKILAGNLDLKSSMRAKALGELSGGWDASSAAGPADVPGMNTRVTHGSESGPLGRGYVWVDPHGRYLSDVGGGSGGGGGGGGSGSGRLLGATAARAEAAAAAGPGPGAGTAALGTGTGGSGGGGLTGLSSRRRAMMTEKQAACAAMAPPQRSMALWTRVNPGCVEATTRLPRSTMKDHFGPKAGAPDADPLDKAHHFQKTDFSEYTEVKLRLMQHLKS